MKIIRKPKKIITEKNFSEEDFIRKKILQMIHLKRDILIKVKYMEIKMKKNQIKNKIRMNHRKKNILIKAKYMKIKKKNQIKGDLALEEDFRLVKKKRRKVSRLIKKN